ncbi:hypothetical protein MMC07_009461 [Pseudocyphellaria aurata]|nr:hypothetical protein [Pseudocyphellaria aurata]
MAPRTEILVHVSAPSRASDDARYRREALGYVHFEAGVRHDVLVQENQQPARSEPAALDVEGGGGSFSDVEWLPTSTDPSSQSSTRNSRAEHKRTVPGRALGQNTGPGRTPEPSRAGFSHLPISATPAIRPRSTVSSRSPYILVEQTPANPRPRSAPTDLSFVQETPRFRRAKSNSWETPPSVIPDSQPSPPNLKRSLPSSSPSPTHRCSSRSPKRRRRRGSSASVETSQICSSSPAPASPLSQPQRPCTSSVRPTTETHRSPILDSASVPFTTILAIYGPPPQPSTETFETHVTPHLQILVNNLPLITFYDPQQLHPQVRPLKIHERGHWAFPILSSLVDIGHKFWTFLETFISLGRASFGILCVVEGRKTEGCVRSHNVGAAELGEAELAKTHRGKEPEAGPSEKAVADIKSKKQVPEEAAWLQGVQNPCLKLYCWGETVPHTWLLLYIASHRRIKGCGAQWIDARGEVIIQMR